MEYRKWFLLFIRFGCDWFVAIELDLGCFESSHWRYKEIWPLATGKRNMFLPKVLSVSPFKPGQVAVIPSLHVPRLCPWHLFLVRAGGTRHAKISQVASQRPQCVSVRPDELGSSESLLESGSFFQHQSLSFDNVPWSYKPSPLAEIWAVDG